MISSSSTGSTIFNLSGDYHRFHDMMPNRIHNILLVSSLYDYFILERDGVLEDKLINEYQHNNIQYAPKIRHVTTAKKALKLITKLHFDVIISHAKIPDMHIVDFAKESKKKNPKIPFLVLANSTDDLSKTQTDGSDHVIDNTFVWTGDPRLIFAIAKSLEDKQNVDNDTKVGDVRVIIVVEDNPRYYSSFLPIIYNEILRQNRELIDSALNTQDTLVRLRSRPKILLARNYEEGVHLFKKHKKNVLGVITDVTFPYKGKLHQTAGIKLAEQIKKINSCIPIVLQSAESKNKVLAEKHGVVFINKNSSTLLKELRVFFLEYFGFGDFIFRDKNHHEIARAKSLNQLERVVKTVPEESLIHHAQHNHFSHWLFARGEFELAKAILPYTLSDFQGISDLREHLSGMIKQARVSRHVGMISDFKEKSFDASLSFVKLGSGSMGGKARSLAFVNCLLSNKMIEQKFPDAEICVPKTLIIASDEFDRFLEDNKLERKALLAKSDELLKEMFYKAELSTTLMSKLHTFLMQVTTPIAVRSSSLFEDSHDQPFAGLYETFMLPNNHSKTDKRLKSLCNAIKGVYASTFSQETKAYFKSTAFRLEEEKMSIIIQELIGHSYGDYFYPDLAGVAQSYNYYPISHMKPEDGIANVVFGFGKGVVDGGSSLRFCPKYPKIMPQFPDPRAYLKYTQKRFYALNLKPSVFDATSEEDIDRFPKLGLHVAQEHGSLNNVGSVYSPENDMIYDGTFRDGAKLVTFSNILKNDLFPLAPILEYLPKVISDAFGGAIEMEFAATLARNEDEKSKFYILQARPFLAMFERDEVEIEEKPKEDVLCKSNIALGNVKMNKIKDIVFVNPETFDHMNTRQIAGEVAELNRVLSEKHKPYLLIGIGRWGTSDTSLGIPITWSQISGADVIIEAALDNFRVDPSNGTHFFHNLTSCKTAYITINPSMHGDFVDWSWLNSQKKQKSLDYTHHITLDEPITITVNGHKAEAQILKPGKK